MKIVIFMLLMTTLLIIGCPPNNHSVDVGSPGSEMGDAVFRSYGIAIVGKAIGHAALYRNSDSKADWDPGSSIINSDFEHSVIQATGEGTDLGWQTFLYFLSELEQKGRGYTHSEAISVETRKKLVKHAKDQYGAAYPHFFEEWYYPKIMTPNSPTERGCFRCDGLVEYVYDQEGLGFFTEDGQKHCFFFDESGWLDFPIFYPEGLRKRMKPDIPCPPELNIISPLNGANVVPQMIIEAEANDGVNGSGIDRIEIYIDDVLLHIDDEDSDGEKTVQHIWNTQGLADGNHKIKIISYDRAGNKAEEEISVHKGQVP